MTLNELKAFLKIGEELPEVLYGLYDGLEEKNELYGEAILENLQSKYAIFEPSNYESVLFGLKAIAENKKLLTWALLAVEYIKLCKTPEEMQKMPMPEPDGTPAGDTVSLLVNIPFLEDGIARYESYGFTREEAIKEIKSFNGCMNSVKRELGRAAYTPRYFRWTSRNIFATLFKYGTLSFEITPYLHRVILLKNNKSGEYSKVMTEGTFHRSGMVLGSAGLTDTEGSFGPHFVETDTEITGYEAKDGYVVPELKTYSKSEWTPVLRNGDKAIYIHIPRNTDLSPEAVKKTIREGCTLVRKKFGEDIKYCYTRTWLLSPNITECLSENSKILQFRNIFDRYPVLSTGKELMTYLYTADTEDYESLPENTSLQRKVKQIYLDGRFIYAGAGIITNEEYYEEQ